MFSADGPSPTPPRRYLHHPFPQRLVTPVPGLSPLHQFSCLHTLLPGLPSQVLGRLFPKGAASPLHLLQTPCALAQTGWALLSRMAGPQDSQALLPRKPWWPRLLSSGPQRAAELTPTLLHLLKCPSAPSGAAHLSVNPQRSLTPGGLQNSQA